ncbi:SLC13 family permease [Thalassospira sp. MCCC 1A03138]|uniref:SLC13 family permease n=1 Tax=Thalassospira sp. MCCC 1A03138 TaxID=1470576 RepID=UPI000A1F84FE|nr:SLC13 family permease [Thalassospira sp. MCCC 1A03138]OSQ32744.1 citrate transporter [Thalassospira sp. MCCC 1A03138]
MELKQILILAILVGTVVMFLWGRWRHDMVAMASLLCCVVAGLVPVDGAFQGFGHPAVITVACILILSSALQQSGAVDNLTRMVLPQSAGPVVTMAALSLLAAILSAFMNNVGALALLMPVALQIAAKQNLPPGKILMPLAFGSILGGMTTLIGTPPNLIVAGFRAEAGEGGFTMFDYTPVGIVVAAAGLVFVMVFGRWLVPTRERAGAEGFETGSYLTEARIAAGSKAIGMMLRDVNRELEKGDAQVIGLIRNEKRIPAPNPYRELYENDILIIEADPEALAVALSALDLKLEEELRDLEAQEKEAKQLEKAENSNEKADSDAKSTATASSKTEKHAKTPQTDAENPDNSRRGAIQSDDIALMELAILPNSGFIGRSATDIHLRTRYGVNLLAVSRQGQRSMARLRTMSMKAGDVLLMQGPPEAIHDFASRLGCVPLAQRALRIPDNAQALKATGIMAAAIGAAAFGVMPAAVAFAIGVLIAMVARVVAPRNVYDAVDWPVIVLLAALIPVANAMETTGTADLVARFLLNWVAQGNAIIALGLILIITMTLSDFMNNAATAAVMCPIAIGSAAQLDANPDAFLMAVAIGASCAFLTPIGHQNNTLILGPGGFRFGDYWRLGLPIEIIVVAVGVPMLLWVWPL